MGCTGATVLSMDESLRFTIVYEDGGEGSIMARVVEVPGAMSQGRTREEAHANVLDALPLMLSPSPTRRALRIATPSR